MMYKSTHHARGFTLVEMAVVVLIASVLMGMAISFAIPIMEASRNLETTQKIKLIKDALAEYAVENNRIPCPSTALLNNNYGIEQGTAAVGAAGFRCNAAGANPNVGMVPFRTLGIAENNVLDAWGNPITYAVSPAFVLSTVDAQASVHENCRTRDWFYANRRPIETDASPVLDVAPINPEKAAFCCAGSVIGNNLTVQDENAINVLVRDRTTMANLAAATTLSSTAMQNPTTQYIPSTSTPTGIVYVLVSHGKNQIRAYTTQTGARILAATGTCEIENGNDDLNYRDCIQNDTTGTANYNDDITGWATQDEMFYSQGESCSVP